MRDQIKRAGEDLLIARTSGKPCAPVRQYIGTDDIKAAYSVQRYVRDRIINDTNAIVGYKIGLTSPAVQKQLGVNMPDFGFLSDQMMVHSDGHLPISTVMQGKAEAELAFVLSHSILNIPSTPDKLIDHIDYVVGAIEVVGSRIANWDITITDTVADNASSSHFILGQERIAPIAIDLLNESMVLKKNDVIVSTGCGSNCLGSPLNALYWLARQMIALGSPLPAGAIILSGALGPMTTIDEDDHFTVAFDHFGQIDLHIDATSH